MSWAADISGRRLPLRPFSLIPRTGALARANEQLRPGYRKSGYLRFPQLIAFPNGVMRNLCNTDEKETPMNLSDIQRVTLSDPPRVVIYGPPGVGKTSLAAEFPAPIFLQTEDGISAGMEIDTFGKLKSWNGVFDALRALANPGHDYQTVVLDSVDQLEPLIWAHVCEENGWESIEAPGYGKGYIEVDALWFKLFAGLNYLRDEFKMNVVLIAHSTIVSWPNPTGAEFPRWDIRLQKRAHCIVEDSVDAILMIDYDNATKEEKGRGGAKTVKSSGSTLRWIHCQGSPARNAKNRYGMPDKVLYNKGEAFTTLAQYFPGATPNSPHPRQPESE